MDAKPLIVGIGASAGGIPAMEGFFRHLPDSDEMAFVVVTHLSPERESLLHQVIARQTSMPVQVAQEGAKVEAGNVYVMPENATLSIEGGRLRLHELEAAHRERKPIDVFFAALAVDQGENAVGIVMSGGDSDGTLGVKAIKASGGITLAQEHDGSGPRNPEMPESAISTGVIDFALPVKEMGEKLQQIQHDRTSIEAFVERQENDAERLRRAQREISRLLRSHSGHDFSGYKGKTFLRRLARRMQVARKDSIEGYMDYLREDPGEVMALFRDLLINVTEFFRDPDAFRILDEKVIPRLFEDRGAGDTIRVWVPGCATGEEVYSLGMLMRKRIEAVRPAPRVQIFGTDIDEAALAVARGGRYPEQLLREIDPDLRQRFFQKEGSSYVVRKEVRDVCIFSAHSLISDPPFSRMDLVSCRNLLIYLGPDLQAQVIPTFHYALKPGGYLFLGTSESLSRHGDLFAPLDKKQRIFQARGQARRPGRRHVSVQASVREAGRFDDHGRAGPASAYQLRQRVESQVLERHAPPHVVTRAEGDIVYYSAGTGRYLEVPRGAPNRQLLDLVRREMRLDLRAALRQAMTTGRPTGFESVLRDEEGESGERVSVGVECLEGQGEGESLLLVTFASLGPPAQAVEAADAGDSGKAERELRDMRERLQSTVEEYETALEELKASNEELVSVNEEAQSTNEELEASKEELQSLNEELGTINAELAAKVEELDRANTDMQNLYAATQIATVFLDGDLVVRNFTPAASAFFNLRPSDVGRPLTELANALGYPELQDHIAAVFATGQMVEHRLNPDGDGRHLLVRLVPYRERTDAVGGVLVTLVDISSLGRAEEHHKVLIAELNHRVKNMLAVVISIANTTRRHAASLDDFAETLIGRLHGMARAFSLLSGGNWSSVGVKELVCQEIDLHGTERSSVDGPEIRLNPQHTLALGMIVHELATNAAKYGALGSENGRVEVTWSAEGPDLVLDWRERDGPRVAEPERKGFGFILIEGQVEHQLGGTFEPSFDAEGFRARLRFPLADAERRREQEGSR
jgi:two-component system CheB/CheR fusion protein